MLGENVSYWIGNPLDQKDIAVLRRIKDTPQSYHAECFSTADRFIVAYLIARGCVQATPPIENLMLTITPKGLDALDFWR